MNWNAWKTKADPEARVWLVNCLHHCFFLISFCALFVMNECYEYKHWYLRNGPWKDNKKWKRKTRRLTDVQSGLHLYSFEDSDWPMSYLISICTQFIHSRSCLGFSIRVVINTRRVTGFYFPVLKINSSFQYFECLLYKMSFNTIDCSFFFRLR